MDKYNGDFLVSLMDQKDNHNCFDCGALSPKWASVNNAIYLCLKCAGVHRGFGVNVSFVRSLTMDSWDAKQIKLLSLGGNRRLRELLAEYSVPENSDPEFRYFIYLLDYYRRLLKSEANGDNPPVKPDLLEALELLNFNNTDKNFDVYKPITSMDFEVEKPKKEEKSFFGRIGSFFEETGQSIKKAAKDLGEKVDDMKIGDKLKRAGTKTVDAFKFAGDKIVDTGKDIMNSEFVQTVANSTEEGISTIVKKTKKLFGKEEDESEVIRDQTVSNENNTQPVILDNSSVDDIAIESVKVERNGGESSSITEENSK